MRDLRNEMYASAESKDISDTENELKTDMRYVTREEYFRKIKELERKIALLESRIENDGWGSK